MILRTYVNSKRMDAPEETIDGTLLAGWGTDLNQDGEMTLVDYGLWIKDAFILPGNKILDLAIEFVPGTAGHLGILTADAPELLAAVVSSLFVCVVILIVWAAVRTVTRALYSLADFARTLRIAIAVRVRSAIRCVISLSRRRPFTRTERGVAIESDISIDDVDLAVLRTQSKLQPGYVLTAPEIANVIRVRPSQVESVLEKLAALQFVEYVFSSLDGYDGYRLTLTGRMYLQVCGERASPA